MSREELTSLLEQLAEEVDRMPQREFSAPAWATARRRRRQRMLLGAAAAAVLVAVPVAVTWNAAPGPKPAPLQTTPSSTTPLRARAAHTATLLADGRVLIVGGCATDGCTTADGTPNTEYYLPGQGFVAGPELIQPRQGHSATLLGDGRVLIAGGWPREGSVPLDSAEVYDPRTGQFAPAGTMTTPRGANTAIPLPDGRVLILGGADDPTATELFDPDHDAFTPAAPLPEGTGIGGAIGLPDGRVLVVGDQDGSGAAQPGAIYDPGSDAWQRTASLPTPRSKFALAPLPDGRVMVLGGTPDDRKLLRTVEIYDPSSDEFEPGPDMDVGRYKFLAVPADDGRVIVAGGTQVAVYDGGQFRPIAGTAAASPRWVTTLTVLPGGDVLIVGGYDERIDLYADALLIDPSQVAGSGP